MLAREALIETGIGGEIAIPHAQSASVRSPAVVYLRLRNSVEWGESGPARHVFGIAVPAEGKDGTHLKILASLARRLLDDGTRNVLERSDSKREILEVLRDPGPRTVSDGPGRHAGEQEAVRPVAKVPPG